MEKTVALSKLVEKVRLECLTPQIDISDKKIITAEMPSPNDPALGRRHSTATATAAPINK